MLNLEFLRENLEFLVLKIPPHPQPADVKQPTDAKQKNANKAILNSSGVLGAVAPKGFRA